MDSTQFVDPQQGAELTDAAAVAPVVQEPPTEEIDIQTLIAEAEKAKRLEQEFQQAQQRLQLTQQQLNQYQAQQFQQAQQAWEREFENRVMAVQNSDLPVDIQKQQIHDIYQERDRQRQAFQMQVLTAVAHQVALNGYADKAIAEFGLPPEYKQQLLTVSHPDLIPYRAQEIKRQLEFEEQQRRDLESQRRAREATQRIQSGAHVLESSRPGTAATTPTYEPGSVAHMAAVLAGAG